MGEWKEYKLGELVEITNGFAFKSEKFLTIKTDDSLPVIKIKNVANGDVHLNDCLFYRYEESLRKHIISKNDILIALTGNHPEVMTQVVGEASRYKLEVKALLNQRVAKIEARKNLDNDFLYYFLKDDSTHDYLASQSAGSANQANISKGNIEDLPINCPPLFEQLTIASILRSLDDKIDLLHRQNKTLEQLAETLFRQWFVEEADESWEEDSLSKYIVVVDNRGKTPPISEEKTEYPLIEANALNGESRLVNYSVIKKFVDEKTFNTWFRDKLKKYDTIMTTVGANIGAMAMYVIDKGNIAQNIIGLSAQRISPFYLYQTLRYRIGEISQLDIGGVQPSVKVPHLLSMIIQIPPKEIEKRFIQTIKPTIDKMENNYLEISTLESLRNTLLPKLMSGEVRVK